MKSSGWSRRDFLTRPVLSVGAMSLGGWGRTALASASSKSPIERQLGKTGVRLPIVSLGVMNADAPGVIRRAYELGVRHFDTAAVYGRGRNEELLGGVFKELGARDKVTIATKVLTPHDRTGLALKKEVARLLDLSLARLQTDYVDILYIHAVGSAAEVSLPGLQEALGEVRAAKKARLVGVSTHSGQAEVLQELARSGFYDVALVSINATMAQDQSLLDAFSLAASKGVGLIAMKTQCGGRGHRPANLPEGKEIHQTAVLKWVLRNPSVTTAIPGATSVEQIEQNFTVAYDLDYTDAEKAFLAETKLGAAIEFCDQCGRCLPTCPKGADLPALMRAHMYARQYGNDALALATLADLPPGRGVAACASCDDCSARCVRGMDAAWRVRDLSAIACA